MKPKHDAYQKRKLMFKILYIPFLLLCIFLTGCGLLDTNQTSNKIGIIELIEPNSSDQNSAEKTVNSDSGYQMEKPEQMLEVPDTVKAGQAFDVKVWTIGLNSCWKEDGADLVQENNNVTITPYDLDTRKEDDSKACLDVIIFPQRTLEIVLETPGEAVINLVGRQIHYDEPEEKIVEYTTTIVVE